MRRLDPADGEAAVLGGSLLGGGGGGDPEWGRRLAGMAFEAGHVDLAQPEELPADGIVITAALVGAPAAPGATVDPADYLTALRMVIDACGGGAVALITNENGGLATVNGWYQASALGIPVLDCPGNGRAHPTGVMGSLNLDLVPGYQAIQACAGGVPGLRMLVSGDLAGCARLTRGASIEAGGLVAVARNPATVEHVAANGARGAITQAIEVGRAMQGARDPLSRMAQVVDALGRERASAVTGVLVGRRLSTDGGFDTGEVLLDDETGRRWSLSFWNEYVLAEVDGRPVAAFPDLIATLDLESGLPVATAAIAGLQPGHHLGVVLAHRAALRLGKTMQRGDLLSTVAAAIGRGALPDPDGAGGES